METENYKKRIESLGYVATDELVNAVVKAHLSRLDDGLVDQAFADLRRHKKKPVMLDGARITGRRGRAAKGGQPVSAAAGTGGKEAAK